MTSEVLWTEDARDDLGAIFHHIAVEEGNYDAAVSIVLGIKNTAKTLSQFPELGTPGRIRGTRELLAEKRYYIIYRLMKGNIQILNVVHTSRQYPPL